MQTNFDNPNKLYIIFEKKYPVKNQSDTNCKQYLIEKKILAGCLKIIGGQNQLSLVHLQYFLTRLKLTLRTQTFNL